MNTMVQLIRRKWFEAILLTAVGAVGWFLLDVLI